MNIISIDQYAQDIFQLSSCVLKNYNIVRETLASPFAAIMLHEFLSISLPPLVRVSIIIPDHFSEYFCVPCNADGTLHIFGPILKVKLNNVAYTNYYEKYHIRKSHTASYSEYISQLPLYCNKEDIRTIMLLYELLNNTPINEATIEIIDLNQKRKKTIPNKKISETLNDDSLDKENLQEYYDTGKVFYHLIQDGNPEQLLQELKNRKIFLHYGLSKSPLTNYRNTAIISLSLAMNAATEGGLNSAVATHLTDMYLTYLENLTDVDDILTLTSIAFQDFAARVRDTKLPSDIPPILQNVISYIHASPEKKLTVSHLADICNMNVTYLSKVFSKHMNMSLSKYITQIKIKEAKRLLSDTSMPLSAISYHLAFSSQNHFQRVFKTETGITPREYRNHPDR